MTPPPIDSVNLRPGHRWPHHRAMQSREALLLECYDSDVDRARFTAHCAIDGPSSPTDAATRDSVELRTLACYERP